jgi:hypothetical protein
MLRNSLDKNNLKSNRKLEEINSRGLGMSFASLIPCILLLSLRIVFLVITILRMKLLVSVIYWIETEVLGLITHAARVMRALIFWPRWGLTLIRRL